MSEYKKTQQAEDDFNRLAQQTYTAKSNENQQEPNHKYDSLYEQNNDLVGWIKIDGTSIDYPVMQTPDNPNYYLHRNFDKEYSVSGTPYVSEICDIEESQNLIIYGHNMRAGGMFHPLLNYTDREFFEKHQTIQFSTLKKENTYQIVYVFKMAAVSGSYEQFPFNCTDFENEADFEKFKAECQFRELYRTSESAVYEDNLITLITCGSNRKDRFVIVAKMI